ncbi:MAG TPA: aldo/keto reductase, partial [Chloroflexota bacterium]|nr:aldo/keto reductase [Chloroflexota bacterium]
MNSGSPLPRRRLGRTRVEVTTLGFGGATIGGIGGRVSEAQAAATLEAAWDAGVRYFDTARYGVPLAAAALQFPLSHP